MEARILGPLEVFVEGARLDIPGGKQRELLAVLLINANEILSSDRLIEELWGETPPSSALKTLQALVSRLRGTLGAAGGALETRGHGYVLRIETGELDADVARTLLEEGRRARAQGDPERASDVLRDALALWRGPALAEFRYEDFAQGEIARLEELRLATTEERIDADLELGLDNELVPELEGLVTEHPLRERLRGQLMLALYRAGRQAEALSAYQEGRRLLAEELGLEPSQALQRLERQILEHDAELAAPERTSVAFAPRRSRRRASWIVVTAGALVLGAAALAIVYLGAGGDTTVPTAGAVELDADTGDALASVALGTAPSAVAVGEGSVWVLDADDKTVSQIDQDTRAVVRTFSTSSTPTDIAVGNGAVWVGNVGPRSDLQLPESISRIEPASGVVSETIELAPMPRGNVFGYAVGSGRNIAVSPDAVWVVDAQQDVRRIDPRSNRVVARLNGVKADSIATGEGRVWVTAADQVVEIDPARNAVARRIRLDFETTGSLAVGAGAVWVTDSENGRIVRVSMDARARQTPIELDQWVADVAFGEGAVWATNEIADVVYRIDPVGEQTTRIEATAPRGIVAGEGQAWVTVAAPPSKDAALPSAVCSDVYFEKDGEPDLLIVSDLTLKGTPRPYGLAMVDGIRFALEQRGFEAGAFSVGFQSCDNATSQAQGVDFFRCGSNAKAYARNLRVVGIFGSYGSPCSYIQIPITNEAEDGPLAMLSPSNTFEGLTTDDELYPTGTRSYFRIAAQNRLEGAAQVELARQLGHRRIVLLTSEWEEYGPPFVESVRSTAAQRGIALVGTSVFDHEAGDYSALVERTAAQRPDAVLLTAVLTPGAGALVKALRARLGPDVPILAPDGFRAIEDVVTLTGPAATSLYVTEYGVPDSRLPARGRQLLAGVAAARGGDPGPEKSASYGAQGAEILLDAIARSDGTRTSVLVEIRKTRVRNGILGDIAFDAKGDLREAPIAVYRFRDGAFVPDRVIVVPTPRPPRP